MSPAAAAPVPRARILVVDDEPGIVDIVATNLAAEGFDIISATTGPAALDVAQRHVPDLIILDIMLPEIDGWEVLRLLESDPRTAGIPVVVLTAKADDLDALRGLELGAVEYVTKPFFPEDLVASVKIHLEVLDPRLRARRRERLIEARRRLAAVHRRD